MKTLYIVRGVPGSGKSTFAKSIGGIHIETDQFFMENGKYNFDITKIKLAHKYCQNQTEPYFKLAEKYGYRTFSLIVENRHGGVNEHDVPEDKLELMKNRFEVKL